MISAVKLSLLLSVMSTVESNDNPHAFNYAEQAYGILQIRQPVIDDVNRFCLQSFEIEDAFDPEKARRIAKLYLYLWASYHKKYSFEDVARMWNGGGPEGWWKLSTLPYWYKVESELKRRGLDSRDTIETWQLPQTKQSPGARSPFTLGTIAESSSRSDLATRFHFVLNASGATAHPSTSFTFTIRPSGSKPAPRPASLRLTLDPAKTPRDAVSFDFQWSETR